LLDRLCAGDAELRQRVEALLAAHEQPESLPHAPIEPFAATTNQPALHRPGAIVAGRYKLLEQIGEGGMGAVWVAEQTDPVRRRVALKLIKPGMDTKQVLSRFAAERQALALMDHPNIARVYDGGMTDEGRPYFVMEYVKGVPITEYCDQARLPIRQRLALFVPVCQAVQHAHQKGIIHRDLKPSNILVCLYDGQPVPKVIDFGLAKAISQPLTDHTLYTAHGLMVGTPLYMSPEQAEFNNLDVDTRTDIYSLGVILYELLTGSTPLEKQRFKDAAFAEILRLIKEEEPPKPSTKLSTTVALPTIAAQRGLDPAQLSRLIRGDLDWIVMKSLEKERARRYETANGLARDVERFLQDEPVEACPPSLAYKLSKFTRRNRRSLITGSLFGGVVAAALLAVMFVIGWAIRDGQTRQAVVERNIRLALQEVKSAYEREELDAARAALQKADGLLASAPVSDDVAGEFQQWKANLAMLDLLDKLQFEKAAGVSQERFDAKRAVVPYEKALGDYGLNLTNLQPVAGAKFLLDCAIRRKLIAALDDYAFLVGGQRGKHVLELTRLADPDPWRNRLRDALARNDLALLKPLAAEDASASQLAAVSATLGSRLFEAGERKLALEVLKRGVRRHPSDYWLNQHLGCQLLRDGSGDEATSYLRAANAQFAASPVGRNNLGVALAAAGKLDEASAEYREAISLAPSFALPHYNLGLLLDNQGKHQEAEAELREAVRLRPDEASFHAGLGEFLLGRQRPLDAVSAYTRAALLAPEDFVIQSRSVEALRQANQLPIAEAGCKTALAKKPDDAVLHRALGDILATQGNFDDAQRAYQQSLRLNPQQQLAYLRLGTLMLEQDKKYGGYEGAEELLRKAVKLHPTDAWAHALLGWALGELDKATEAEEHLRQALDLEPGLTSCVMMIQRLRFTSSRSAPTSSDDYRRLMYARVSDVGGRYELGVVERSPGFRAVDLAVSRRSFGPAFRGSRRSTVSVDPAVEEARLKEAVKNSRSIQPRLELSAFYTSQRKFADADAQAWYAVRQEPGNYLAHRELASTTFLRPSYAEAALREAIRLNKDDSQSHQKLAIALFSQGRLDEAISSAKEAVRLLPADGSAYVVLARCLARKGDYGQAEAAYRQALATRAVALLTVQADLGWMLIRAGKIDEGEKELAAAKRALPPLFPSDIDAGHRYAAVGQTWEAAQLFQRAYAQNPQDSASGLRAAHLLLFEGNRPAYEVVCRQMLKQFAETTDIANARRTLQVCLLTPEVIGTPAEHKRLLATAVIQAEHPVISRRERGLAAFRQGKWDEALALCRDSRRENRPVKQSWYYDSHNLLVEAMVLHKQGQSTPAMQAYRAAARSANWYYPYAPHELGSSWVDWITYELLRREAAALLQVGKDDSDWPYSMDRARLYAAEGDWKRAAAEFRRACQSPFADTYLWTQTGLALAMADDRTGHREHCLAYIKEFAGDEEPTTLERIAKTVFLVPDNADLGQPFAAKVGIQLEGGTLNTAVAPWGANCVAFAALRRGDWSEAKLRADRTATSTDSMLTQARVTAYLIAALAAEKLGENSLARERFAEAIRLRDGVMPFTPEGTCDRRLLLLERNTWHDWVLIDILQREAGQLLGIPGEGNGRQEFERAKVLAAKGDWQAAARDFRESCQAPGLDSARWMGAAVAQLAAGDEPAYGQLCEQMLARFGASKDVYEAERTTKICLIRPGIVNVSQLPVGIFSERIDDGKDPHNFAQFAFPARALARYREGNWKGCLADAQQTASNRATVVFSHAQTHFVAAMANHQLQDHEAAAKHLAAGNALLFAVAPRDASGATDYAKLIAQRGDWWDWIIADQLSREAEALLRTPDSAK
jgi:serine/threonine protein kinase/Flp pilus assembly protein TadD